LLLSDRSVLAFISMSLLAGFGAARAKNSFAAAYSGSTARRYLLRATRPRPVPEAANAPPAVLVGNIHRSSLHLDHFPFFCGHTGWLPHAIDACGAPDRFTKTRWILPQAVHFPGFATITIAEFADQSRMKPA
jgi:hypothetical protein